MKSNINHSLRTFQSIEAYWKQGNIYKFTTPGYPSLPAEDHYKDGWRDYVALEYDPATHKLGGLIYDAEKDVVTNQVIAFTPEELAQREQAAIDSDASAQKRQRESADGRTMFEQFLIYIQRRFDKGEITGNQALSAMTMLYTPLLPLKDGMFKFAQANLNAVTPPANQILLDMLNLAKQKVTNYIAENP